MLAVCTVEVFVLVKTGVRRAHNLNLVRTTVSDIAYLSEILVGERQV